MKIELISVGVVENTRKTPEDDDWDKIVSTIVLDTTVVSEESLMGLEEFSHAEVLFYMDRVNPDKIQAGARHPRNNTSWPLAGIFAQRGKNRPNQLGASICRILEVNERRLTVRGLDAINGTPVVDIKPYMVEFGPRGEVVQPDWSHEIMKYYYRKT